MRLSSMRRVRVRVRLLVLVRPSMQMRLLEPIMGLTVLLVKPSMVTVLMAVPPRGLTSRISSNRLCRVLGLLAVPWWCRRMDPVGRVARRRVGCPVNGVLVLLWRIRVRET